MSLDRSSRGTSISDARLVVLVLLACAGAAGLAKQGEARFVARRAAVPALARKSEEASAATRPTSEGDRLRDGMTLDLNRATAAELELLPGVGPRLAREIVALRTRRGGFSSLDALDEVRGIGPHKLARLRPFLHLGR